MKYTYMWLFSKTALPGASVLRCDTVYFGRLGSNMRRELDQNSLWNKICRICRKADNRMNEWMKDHFFGMRRITLCMLVFSVHWRMHTQVYSHNTSQLLCDISEVHFIIDGYLKRPHDNKKEERGDEKSTTRNDKWETWLFRDSQALYSQSKPAINIYDFIAFITVK
jgi:hypothetical protein